MTGFEMLFERRFRATALETTALLQVNFREQAVRLPTAA